MNNPRESLVRIVTRLFLGLLFVLLGATKAADPIAFLKLVREFHVLTSAPELNFVAAVLPWFEIFCGVLLLVGRQARAAASLQALLLLAFTVLVAVRGVAVHLATGIPFCGVRFDCGCGNGEVFVCLKLVENVGLTALACFVGTSAGQRAQPQAS